MSVPQGIKYLLIRLADQYETKDFIKDDPIRFPHEVAKRGGSRRDIEIRRHDVHIPLGVIDDVDIHHLAD